MDGELISNGYANESQKRGISVTSYIFSLSPINVLHRRIDHHSQTSNPVFSTSHRFRSFRDSAIYAESASVWGAQGTEKACRSKASAFITDFSLGRI